MPAPELLDGSDSFGSVLYRYGANSESNMFAASMVQRNGTPIGFHFDGEPLDKGHDSGSIESIWWMPRPTTSEYLILSNAAPRPLVASLVISDVVGRSFQQSIELGPAQTQRIDLRAIAQTAGFGGSQGGISVSVASGAGHLMASHIAFDESIGMSATMKTFERDPAEKPKLHTLRAPMIALSVPDPALMFPGSTALVPQLFLRNATSAPLEAALTLDWRSPSQRGSLPLPAIDLASGAARLLNLTEFTRQAGLPADAYWGTVVVKYLRPLWRPGTRCH